MSVNSNGNYRREERSPLPSQPVQLNFKNHCLFCLEPQPPSTIQEIRDSNPKNLRSLQPVLHYLTGTDPTYDESTEECGWMGVPAVGNLPPMCLSCYDAMAELYRLHEELLNIQFLIQEQTQLARQTVPLRSQSSSRQQFLARIKSSGLSVEEVTAVRKFVDNLHNKIIAEVSGKKHVIFPACVPPEFFSNSERRLNFPPDCTATWSTAFSEMPDASFKYENVTSPSSVLGNVEVVMLPSIVETDDIKYENEYGDEEMSEPDMIIPDNKDIISEQPSSDSTRDSPSPIAVPRKRVSRRIKFKKQTSCFEPSGFPTSAVGPRRKQSVADKKFKKDNAKGVGKTSRRRAANIRKVINSVSTVQYCDLCNKLLPLAEILKHLEDGHNLKGYIVECPNPQCPYLFSCHLKLARHLKNQNPRKCQIAAKLPAGPMLQKCETCDFETSSATTFRNHLQKHELTMPEKTIRCPIEGCAERCALRQSIEDHINFHELRPPKTDQECSVCKKLIQIEDVTGHLKEVHKIDEPVPCKRCPFIFHDWESLVDHLSEHYSPGGLSCDICDNGIRFEKLEFLRQHYFVAHEIGEEFICEHCHKAFFIQTMLSTHIKRNHSSGMKDGAKKKSNKKVKCELCPEPIFFASKDAMRPHNIKFHDGDPLSCKFCDKTFVTDYSLKRHRSEHTGLAREFKCSVEGCGRVFQNRTLLRKHELGKHSETQPFVCDACGKKFNYRSALKAHVDLMHLGKTKKCVCETCGKTLASKNSLRTHMVVHTVERPHVCHICNQTFRSLMTMRGHVRAHEEKGESFRPKGPRSK